MGRADVNANGFEVVLPGGGFASFGAMKGRHLAAAYAAFDQDRSKNFSFLMAVQTGRFDGLPLTYQMLEEMDIQDASAILAAMNKIISAPITA